MFSRRTSSRTRKSRQRMLALKVSSPRILMFDCLKFCARFLKLGIAMLVMVGLGFGLSYGWQKLFVENEEFLIGDISLTTMEGEAPRFLNHKRLEFETGLSPETTKTIFSVDTEKVRDKLLALPEITAAKVTRRLPDLVKVEVEEREPVAWVACRSLGIKERDREFGFLVDAEGVVFPCVSEALWKYAETLPVMLIQKAERNEIVEGEVMTNKGLRYALKWVNLTAEKLEGHDRLAWVVVKDEIMLETKTLEGVVATLSYYEQERQLKNLSRVVAHARDQGRSLEKVNLIPRRYVPVYYR